MTKKRYVVIIILVIIALGYWFVYRPSQIKKECFVDAWGEARDIFNERVGFSKSTKGWCFKNDFDYYYRHCLKEKGL